MQSMSKMASEDSKRPAKLTVFNTLKYVYDTNGIKGLYRGVTPRIGLGIWQTICMVRNESLASVRSLVLNSCAQVAFADHVRQWLAGK
jgi:hypothetical protein